MDSHRESDNPLRVQARSRGGWWSTWALTESRAILCGSRRDQEEDSGVRGLSQRVGQSFAGPGEIKRRVVEYVGSHRESGNPLRVQARSRVGWWSTWALIESRTILCGSRQDQEEGGGVRGLS